MLRDNNLRRAASRGGVRSPCTAVVDNRSHTFEQCLLVDLTDGDAVGFVVYGCQVCPTAEEDRSMPQRASRFDHHAVEIFGRADAAEAEVDRWIARVEECLQLGGEGTFIFHDPCTGLEDGLIRG